MTRRYLRSPRVFHPTHEVLKATYEVLRPLPAHPVSSPPYTSHQVGYCYRPLTVPLPLGIVRSLPRANASTHCFLASTHCPPTSIVSRRCVHTTRCRRRRRHKHGLCRTQSQCTNKRRVPGHQGLGPRAVKKVRRVLVPLPCVSSVPLPYVSSGCLFRPSSVPLRVPLPCVSSFVIQGPLRTCSVPTCMYPLTTYPPNRPTNASRLPPGCLPAAPHPSATRRLPRTTTSRVPPSRV